MALKQGKEVKRPVLPSEDDLSFAPWQVDFANMRIRQKPGNPLGMWIGDYPTNYAEFETDGTLELHGDATVWDDLRVPVTTAKPGAVVPDFAQFLAGGGLKTYLFDGTARVEEIHFTVQMPHGYKVGTDIVPHVHWTPTDTNVGDVRWSLEYTWADITDTFPNSITLHTVDTTSGTAWDHQLTNFSAIVGSGTTGISSMLVCRLYSDASHGDDSYEYDAALLEIDFHYELDTIGSRKILSK